MSKLIKRKDGSYSKRGLWDNIRANKGSGKEPTKEMLKQESKIKKEESMNSMYKKGGKASKKPMKKESFMEESKELHFGAPGVKPPMKKKMMGGKYEMGGGPGKGLFEKINDTTNALSASAASKKADADFDKAAKFKTTSSETLDTLNARSMRASKTSRDAIQKANEKKMGGMYKKGGFPDLNNDNEITFGDILKGRLKGKEKMMGGKYEMGGDSGAETPSKRKKEGTYSSEQKARHSRASFENGGKSMAPGGGGRFEALVNKLKSKGKSEEAAEGIAASAGRAKYGKSKFQAMAAKGKKK